MKRLIYIITVLCLMADITICFSEDDFIFKSSPNESRVYGTDKYGLKKTTPDIKDKYLGRYSSNPYDSDSVSNPYGQYGSKYSSDSINNPYGQYGSSYSSRSANNPYATDTPELYGSDGKHLGKVSSNPYDSDSISNPYGRYGSPYSPDSINNPYSQYGSPYSSKSANNPYATDAPYIVKTPETKSTIDLNIKK